MWNRLWRSVGRGAGVAARSLKSASGPAQAAVAVGQLAVPVKGVGGVTGQALRKVIPAGCVAALLVPRFGRATTRLFGFTSTALWRRAVLVGPGVHVCYRALRRALAFRRHRTSAAEAAEKQAEMIVGILDEKGVTPDKIGVDGLPGSGKSTLARALAEKLDMKWESLDYRNLRLPGNLSAGRTVYEHHRLFRTQDVDAFDVIVFIDESTRRCKARVCRRGRGLLLAAFLNYTKLKKVGRLAFDVCDGEPVPIPDSPLVLKVKPPDGFHAVENAVSRLGVARLPGTAGSAELYTPGMDKEEMLLLLACGKRQRGLKAYLVPLDYFARLGRLVSASRLAGRNFAAAWFEESPAVQPAHGASGG